MIDRRPIWRVDRRADWGLPRYRWRDALVEAACVVPRLGAVARLRLSYLTTPAALARHPHPRLALGSGPVPPDGWCGLDISRTGTNVFRADLRLGLPARTGTVDAILAEHVLEHLCFDDLPRLFAECRRVLRPGRPIRIVSPDAGHLARLLTLADSAEADPAVAHDASVHRWDADGMRWARTVNRVSHQWGEHRSLLTAGMVASFLATAGFVAVHAPPAGESVHFPVPPDVHARRFPDEPKHVNFAVEALAPGDTA